MPASKAVSIGVVLTNGTDFISLFFRSEKNDLNNEVVDKFYWVQSNASGVPTSGRNNSLNGYFSSQSAAESDTPDGYGEVPPEDEFQSRYSLGYYEGFPFSQELGLAGYPDVVTRTNAAYSAAAAAGYDRCMFSVPWDFIFATYAEQTTNNTSSWALLDSIISHAKSLTTTNGKPMNICLRIVVNKDDGFHYDLDGSTPSSGFYGLSNSAKNQLGHPIRVGRGFGHVSLAYSAGLVQVYDFVTKALIHYKNLLGSQFEWYSVVTSSQDENGSNYENQHYEIGANSPVPAYPSLFDYSTYSQEGFRTWLASSEKYNNNIANLRTAWGSLDNSFGEIVPPGLGMTGTHEELSNVYKSNKGKDWYDWNVRLMDNFITNCRQIGITNNVSAKFVTETGSDTDILSINRQTIDIKRWARLSQLHKSQLGGLSRNTSFAISIDILRTNIARNGCKLGTEINTQDFVEQLGITDATEMGNAMFEMAQYCILDAEAKDITVISTIVRPYFQTAMSAATRIRSLMNSGNNGRVPITIPKFEYSKKQILDNGIAWLNSSWINSTGGLNSRVQMLQNDETTVITPPAGCNHAIQLYPIHTYCLNTLGIIYNNCDTDASVQENLKNTHFRLSLPTHSISYISVQPTLVNYKITGANGIVYLKNTQHQPYVSTGDYSNPYQNNHPFLGVATNVGYAANNFFLPINQTYTIEVENLTPLNAITSVLTYLNIDGQNTSPDVHRKKVTSSIDIFTFNPALIGTTFMRFVKFNINRLNDTDSLPDI